MLANIPIHITTFGAEVMTETLDLIGLFFTSGILMILDKRWFANPSDACNMAGGTSTGPVLKNKNIWKPYQRYNFNFNTV